MKRLTAVAAVVLVALVGAAAAKAGNHWSVSGGGPFAGFSRLTLTSAAREASCTAAQKAARLAALRAFQKRMIAQRRAYFRAHASVKLRRAFVKRQQARLKVLKAAAACTVALPAPPPTTPADTDSAVLYRAALLAIPRPRTGATVRERGSHELQHSSAR